MMFFSKSRWQMKFIPLQHGSVNFNNNTPVFCKEGSHAIRLVSHQLLFLTFCTILPPANEVGEGNIFTGVSHSVQGVLGVPGPFWGGGNAWSEVSSRGLVCLAYSQVLFWGARGCMPGRPSVHPRRYTLSLEGAPHLEGTPSSADI